jgi:hypothetical protein
VLSVVRASMFGRRVDVPYYFHLRGEIEAQDAHGQECKDDDGDRGHADFIAHRIGTERPDMVRPGNSIVAVNAYGVTLARCASFIADHPSQSA